MVKAIPSALPAWLVQRLGALYMLLFLLYALVRWDLARPVGYSAWRSWVLDGSMRVPLTLFVIALLLHAWVGLRDVVLDYVDPLPLRLATLALVGAGLAAIAIDLAPVLMV